MKPVVAIVGAGVAGAIVAEALARRGDVEVICLERAARGAHAEAGTGLNVGPNAMKALASHFPQIAARIRAASLPWRRWTTGLTDGTILWDLDLATVADNPGVRIRWSELYRLVREPLDGMVEFGASLEHASFDASGATLRWRTADGAVRVRDGVDLVLGCDGRFGWLREAAFGPSPPSHLGIVIYRVLFDAPPSVPVDEYGQWFAGPNRLLAFRLPDGAIYCAGSFPIPPGDPIPETMKDVATLRALYTLPTGLSPTCAALVDGIVGHLDQIHWARVQDGPIRYAHRSGRLLLLGDAAHPMAPTLGQGATQAIEDACVAAHEIAAALDARTPLNAVPASVAARRTERVRFVSRLSRDASDTMLDGADPVAGVAWKREPGFMRALERLYRATPEPATSPARALS